MARGLVELRRNPQWGKDRNVTLEVKYESSRGEVVGSLSFVAGSAPYSTNNLEAAQSQGWNGKAVPPEFIHLVGVGKCRGQQQIVEAWYHAPTYPWAIAAGGPVRLTGGARIAGLPHVPPPGQAVDASQLGPADLRCNGDSVMLGKGTEVYGDVLTSGQVEVEPGANLTVGPVAPVTPMRDSVWVRGAIKDGTGEPEITGVNLGRFDPDVAGLAHSTVREERYNELYTVGDTRRREGNVEFSSGLKMDGGLLFVEGDLTVRGGMTGSGLVVCTGRVTVEGASSLASGSGVALVAGGEVALTGSGSDGSYFQGLVYTDTGFSADKVSLVGALVSRGTGAVELHEAQMLMPEELPKEWSGGGGAGGIGSSGGTQLTVYQVDDSSKTKKINLAAGEKWKHAFVFEKVDDTRFIQWTFSDTGGPPAPADLSAQQTSNTLGHWLGGLPGLDAFAQLNEQTPVADPTVPPPLPGVPSSGSPLVVRPSEFFRLKDRLRLTLWVGS